MEKNSADLKEYLDNAKCVLKQFEDALGWKEIGTDETSLVSCPINHEHKVPMKSLESHTQRCKWRKWGYSHQEIDEIIDAENNELGGSAINVDDIISKIAPNLPPLRTHERYVSTLTNAERSLIYDEIRRKFNKSNKELDVSLYEDLNKKAAELSKNETTKSDLEAIKELRDHKRRRQSYRAKNVHVTKRSQTEIIRDVLAVHMEQLRQLWNPESKHLDSFDEALRTSRSRDPELRKQSNERQSYERQSYERQSHERQSYERSHRKHGLKDVNEESSSRDRNSIRSTTNEREESDKTDLKVPNKEEFHHKHRKRHKSDRDSHKKKKKKKSSKHSSRYLDKKESDKRWFDEEDEVHSKHKKRPKREREYDEAYN